AMFVIECLPNVGAQDVTERTEPLVRTVRKSRPQTPIVLAEDPTYCHAALLERVRQRSLDNRAALRKVYDKLVADGVPNLHLLPGEKQYGNDGEATVDGVHATDLGFLRLADAYEPVLAGILRGDKRLAEAKPDSPKPPAELAEFFAPPEKYRN